ncbi:MAG: type III-A CRISPR-associated protein Cas10/Csm1 [Desulfatibacillaceae bacterium]|nr:type III-A CRISPR-associated protein Cas10/Csm1 [Desulfatibacillaceae bacterium]
MDDTVRKIAMAGFFHDIGKFAEREILGVTALYEQQNADIYQPSAKGYHTHVHALHTAAFIEHEAMKAALPAQCSLPKWGEGDSFINLAACHHKPETPMQWIITEADRLSSGVDRDTFDSAHNTAIPVKDYQSTRLLPIFEQLEAPDISGSKDAFRFVYPLAVLSPENIFPVKKEIGVPKGKDLAKQEYLSLFKAFFEAVPKLLHKDDIDLWFEHFDSLFLHYASAIPQARVGSIVPDVSLYDHCRMTAALATALYIYHRDNGTLTEKAIKDEQEKKFLFIQGDCYGIQDFIFRGFGDTRRFRSKLLRGRSFAVSLFSELAADMICREIGLPFSSVVENAAGKFAVIAPNTPLVRQKVQDVWQEITKWLFDQTFGETMIGISTLDANAVDFTGHGYKKFRARLAKAAENCKASRFDAGLYCGSVSSYLDDFDNSLSDSLCPFCGKRPSSPLAQNDPYLKSEGASGQENASACSICRDHIYLGTSLVKKSRLAVLKNQQDHPLKSDCLLAPIFGRYQLVFSNGGDFSGLSKKGLTLLRCFDIGADFSKSASRECATRYMAGYVPVYRDEDMNDPRFIEGRRSDEKQMEMIEQLEHGKPKTFSHIAAAAKNPLGERPGSFVGMEALGVLKADVDNLGKLFAEGLKPERHTLSRLATLSRQLHFFFAVYLPHLLEQDERFKDVYTVFAGGDDLLLIGPWNRMFALALFLQEKFADYVCHNPKISFSAGITLHRPSAPLDQIGKAAEDALEASKNAGKNSLTYFGQTVTWQNARQLSGVKAVLLQWLEARHASRGIIYRLNYLIDMAALERSLVSGRDIHITDMNCTRWRAFLTYSTQRNAGKELKGEQRERVVKDIIANTAKWLNDFGGALRIGLWEVLYNIRRR